MSRTKDRRSFNFNSIIKKIMSILGSKKLKIPSNVEIELNENTIVLSSRLGKLIHNVHSEFCINLTKDELLNKSSLKLSPKKTHTKNLTKQIKTLWGTEYSNIKNSIEGISKGYSLSLNLKGVGFKANISKNSLNLKLGYSHEVTFLIPENIIIQCPKPDKLFIFGIDKKHVHTVVSDIQRLKDKDVYKGKGILLENERIILKEGKKK